ncbi:hypothetical protein OH77DRAFT_1521354 [Trametes cingulata]|nr:hypothetical protein OH77DRAFT_1521354 [Trametes cingulata]
MASSSRARQTKLSFPSLSQNPPKGKTVKASDHSNVPPGRTITRTDAKKQYRVTDKQLDNLSSIDTRYPIYREQDVERKAWERHKGKKNFIAYLKDLYEEHVKEAAKLPKGQRAKRFQVPDGYRCDVTGEGSPFTSTPGPSLSRQKNAPLPETYQPAELSPRLLRIHQDMPPWLWDRFTPHLDRIDEQPSGSAQGGLSLSEREALMVSAAEFAKNYPARLTTSLDPSSASLQSVRAVLASSPQAPSQGEERWGVPVEGLEVYRKPLSRDPDTVLVYYDWDADYKKRLFTALGAFVDMYGTGEEGWASLRWEVYDTYMARIGPPIHYSRTDGRWVDPSFHWLESHAHLYRGLHKYRHGLASPTSSSNSGRPLRLSSPRSSPREPQLERVRSKSPPRLPKHPSPARARLGPSSMVSGRMHV